MEEPTSTRAGAKLDPASWPMAGGKIMFPAPKKMANRVRETERSCLRLSFFIKWGSFSVGNWVGLLERISVGKSRIRGCVVGPNSSARDKHF